MQVSEMVKNVNFACSPITNINNIIKRSLNRGQQAIASAAPHKGWVFLRVSGDTLNVSITTPEVILTHRVDTSKILTLYCTENPQFINPISESEFRFYEPDPNAVGVPYLYRWMGTSPVGMQPTSASVVTVVSTSTADDTGGATPVAITIFGKNASGVDVVEVLTLNGTTPVVGTQSFSHIQSMGKNAYCTGIITATSNAGAVTNVIYGPRDRELRHPVINLYPTPDSDTGYFYDYTLLPPNIWDDNDVPIYPEQYHDVIELFAKAEVFQHLNNPTMATLCFQQYQARLKDMENSQRSPQGIVTMNPFMPEDCIQTPMLPDNFPRSSY